MIIEYLLEKALDKTKELVQLGFRKLDSNQTFLVAYENALKAYKSEFGEDELYCFFFKGDYMYYYKIIKDIVDESPSTRELENNLVAKIVSFLPDYSLENINMFIINIFTELLLTNEYNAKILEYRRDDEIGKIYTAILELKEMINESQPINEKFSNNMFQYYLNKWNNDLFLHKNAYNKIHLRDIYILPFYKEQNSSKPNDIRGDLEEKIDLFLGDSISGNRRRPMIILADAGMGKSSLVSYICSKCPQKNNLIVLKFSDLHKDSLNTKIIQSVLHELNCEIKDLRNKRLIIDGFDESEFTSDRNKLLSNFFYDCQNIQGLKVLITSRVNYVDYNKFKSSKLYYLQFMNEDQISKMCRKYFDLSGETPFSINNISNSEVIGVPLILYMILSLKIHVEEGTGICELYEKIFAFNGGIYDRMTFEDYDGYTEEVHPIAYENVKKDVHLISQLIAFSMFETNSLQLAREKYLAIVKTVSVDRVEDFAISNYYHIESSSYSLSFCHKSIYEYFVAEYIYSTISQYTDEETIARNLSFLLKSKLLTNEILIFLVYKIEKNFEKDDNNYLLIESVVNLMIENGMTYFLDSKVMDVLKVESNIFTNILLILNIYYIGTYYSDYKDIKITEQFLRQLSNRLDSYIDLKNIKLQNIVLEQKKFLTNLDLSYSYLFNISFDGSDLSASVIESAFLERISFKNKSILDNTKFNNTYFENINMSSSYFTNCEFVSCIINEIRGEKAFFERCNFEKAKLTDVNFKGADLSYANFKRTVLSDVNLSSAILKNTDFRGADLSGVNMRFAQQVTSIKIDSKSVFNNATVDSIVVPKLLTYCPKNLKGLKIYDESSKKEMTLDEYKKEQVNR